MITTIKNDNSILYKDLFLKASEVLSGYERTQTFNDNETYFYKDSETNSFVEFVFEDESNKLYEFANALTQYGYLYISNGKNPSDYNFIPEIGITTLEEYYNWLPEIKKDAEGKPTVFTKLPLDEAHFEINPNTRAIIVPAEFKKNGIAVQGDDLAEVVYFMIDRYFDAMDLNNTEIYIEWETPKGPNGAVKSVSETYLKLIDDENYPGKLIFGWAISDAITKYSGTLKFSVRFVQWEEKRIVYSFNTLTAQVTIHPNLGLDLENDTYEIDNCNERLLERIKPSEVVGNIKASTPYFLTNLILLEDGYDIEDNHTTGTYNLEVVATTNDTGVISYVWKRADLDENNICDDTWVEIPGSSEVKMVALTEEELEAFNYKLPEDHIYHVDSDSNNTQLLSKGYYDLTDAGTKAWFLSKFNVDIDAGDLPVIYEQRSVLTVEKYGKYKAEARNRIFNSLTVAASNIATFNRPEAVEMDNTNQTADKHIVGEDSAVLTPVIVESVGDLGYQWFKDGEEIVDSNELTYVATEPGMYKLSVVRTRNRATTEGESIEYRVTNAPVVPEYAEGIYEGTVIVSIEDLEAGETLSIEWNNDIESDSFEVAWYLYRGSKGDLEIVKFETTENISHFNPINEEYAKTFEDAKEDYEGYYYAVVRNILNGVKSSYSEKPIDQTQMFSVTGA